MESSIRPIKAQITENIIITKSIIITSLPANFLAVLSTNTGIIRVCSITPKDPPIINTAKTISEASTKPLGIAVKALIGSMGLLSMTLNVPGTTTCRLLGPSSLSNSPAGINQEAMDAMIINPTKMTKT